MLPLLAKLREDLGGLCVVEDEKIVYSRSVFDRLPFHQARASG